MRHATSRALSRSLDGGRLGGMEPAGIEPATSGCKPGALPAELWPLAKKDRAGDARAGSVVEVEVLRGLLLEPEVVVLGRVLEEVRRVLEHVLVLGLARLWPSLGLLVLGVVVAVLLRSAAQPRARR